MNLTVKIQGQGQVTGAGEYPSGAEIVVEAKPAPLSNFKKWDDGSASPKKTIIASDDDVALIATFFMTFEDYLRSRVKFEVTDSDLAFIREQLGIPYLSDVAELSEMQKEVGYAYLLLQAATMPSETRGDKIKQGNRAYEKGSTTFLTTDRLQMRKIAEDILAKYGLKIKEIDPNYRW